MPKRRATVFASKNAQAQVSVDSLAKAITEAVKMARRRAPAISSGNAQAQVSIDNFVKSIIEVAKTARLLMTSVLLMALTLTALLVGASDEALFRDNAEILPSLGVKLRLSTAFTLAPPIFAFLHVNALLQFHLLAKRLLALEDAFRGHHISPGNRRKWRHLLHGISFLQLLTVESGPRHWPYRALLAITSWLSIVAVPVTLLIATQISFLRYQNAYITAIHQASVVLDITVLLWFHISTWGNAADSRYLSAAWSSLTAISAATLLWLSLGQAIPASADLDAASLRWQPTISDKRSLPSILWDDAIIPALATDTLTPMRGDIFLLDRLAAISGWPWMRRYLDLRNLTLINNEARPDLLKPFDFGDDGLAPDHWTLRLQEARRRELGLLNELLENNKKIMQQTKELAKKLSKQQKQEDTEEYNNIWHELHERMTKKDRKTITDYANNGLADAQRKLSSLSVARRNFRFANFDDTQIFSANLNGSDIRKGTFVRARMQGIQMAGARLEGAILHRARLHGASLNGAHLEEAQIDFAILSKSNLSHASLTGANLMGARLIAADLSETHLEGANLNYSDLSNAKLQGAYLNGARMENTILDAANLNLASIHAAIISPASSAFAKGELTGCDSAIISITDGAASTKNKVESLVEKLEIAVARNNEEIPDIDIGVFRCDTGEPLSRKTTMKPTQYSLLSAAINVACSDDILISPIIATSKRYKKYIGELDPDTFDKIIGDSYKSPCKFIDEYLYINMID